MIFEAVLFPAPMLPASATNYLVLIDGSYLDRSEFRSQGGFESTST